MSTDAEKREAENEEAAAVQRLGARRMSLEERFRQNDSMSQFRAAALASRQRGA